MALNLRRIEQYLREEDIPTDWVITKVAVETRCVPRLWGRWATAGLSDPQVMQLWMSWASSRKRLGNSNWESVLIEQKSTNFREFLSWCWGMFGLS